MNKNKKLCMIGFAVTGGVLFTAFQNFTDVTNPGAKACSVAKVNELLEPATDTKWIVKLNCSTKLPAAQQITKQIIYEGKAASGATLDCAGSTIYKAGADALVIRSKVVMKDNVKTWERPENVTVKNCNIQGGVRIYGMAKNGEGLDLRESSRQDANHSKRAKDNAPKNIMLHKIKIASEGRIALYISPGVTFVTLQNSSISGNSPLAVYLDAESANNSFLNNSINTVTEKRELFAIDGSANNIIQGNKFSSLSNGGIYVYRNCGEGGTIRHQTPSGNKIQDNIFYYNKYKGGNPSILLGSRNGNRKYCDLDNGFPWGSSVNDGDYARNNIVTGNKIYVRSVNDMIVSNHSSNQVNTNYTVTAATVNSVGAPPVVTKPIVTSPGNSCQAISKSCGYDMGLYRDGQRGGVKGYLKRDNKCNYSVRVTASKNGADSGFINAKSVQVVGDRGYRYTAKIANNEFVVTSSAGQEVCQINL
ncbi:right-handed parallel beta-helix repeat-containing protein [Bacteriovorax sp. PP10]|uniref:Right-handed parallel beta-helix repeat-containing protein n=1 Tax=Bacteriovorax antarcticus TaxID=3088717 RepID=A0ABU5VXW6_9BACT|nr:right-handed parallel beta-helix repeat-containing protein [Bacteriovorax sp. PP10]MEA9357913.1 right-handed parallel beta-helix repeat-containing protein [Bacteriovorax sp. PP10]